MRQFMLTAGAVSLAMALTACSPAEETAAENSAENAAAAGADAAASAAAGPMQPGGAVSPPQGNEALDTAATTETNPSAGSTSFTEGQAREAFEKAGYTGVTALTKTPEGLWTGQAMKGGKTATVSLDFKGDVSAR